MIFKIIIINIYESICNTGRMLVTQLAVHPPTVQFCDSWGEIDLPVKGMG